MLQSWTSILAGVICLWCASASPAQSVSNITRVEEEWEMEVISASDDLTAPQVVMQMAPDNANEQDFFTFEINHSSLPSVESGGLQVQTYVNNEPYSYQLSPTERTLERTREVLRWLQSMTVTEGAVEFKVDWFNSASIGRFRDEPLMSATLPASVTDLSSYSPTFSVTNSGVPYAKNRVRYLILRKIRYYSGDELVQETSPDLNLMDQ
jgi:hypothetical protein